MKTWQKILVAVAVFTLLGVTACSLPGKANAGSNVVTVKKGDLAVSVSGSGNLEAYQDIRLSFGSAGKVAEVLYKEGDWVTQGQVVAKLEVDALTAAVTEAGVNVTKAQVAVTQAELAVNQEPITKEKAQMAVTQAELDLKRAETALEQTVSTTSLSDSRIARAEVDTAAKNLADSLVFLTGYAPGTPSYLEYEKNVVLAQVRLKTAQDKLDAMLNGFSIDEVAIKQQQVEIARKSLDVAKKILAVELQPREAAQQSLTLAQQSLVLAQQSRELAQKRLNDAVITAPFDGIIADVKAKSGDFVDGVTPVIYLVKPTQLEVVVEIDEMDIPKVVVGQQVNVDVDALPGKIFEGIVASVYPVPTKVTGLVMYNVRIALTVPEDAGLKIGMRTTANIIVEKKTGVIKLPNQIVKEDGQGGHYVNVLADNKTSKRPVTLGVNNDTETEIITGLKESETVVN